MKKSFGQLFSEMLQVKVTLPYSYFNPNNKCATDYGANSEVCGTDGKTYGNLSSLRCEQKEEYGKRVNLQLSHNMPCWIWEKYGFGTTTLCFVSNLLYGG